MTSFLENFTNFGGFTLPVFLFYLFISLLTYIFSLNYFSKKINNLKSYNRSLQEDFNNFVVTKKSEQILFTKNTYTKSSQTIIDDKVELNPIFQLEANKNEVSIVEKQIFIKEDILENAEAENLNLYDGSKDFKSENINLEINASEITQLQILEDLNIETKKTTESVIVQPTMEALNIEKSENEESNKVENIESEPILKENFEVIELLPIEQVIGRASNAANVPVKQVKIDDLKLIEGIGFKIQEILNAKGIHSFEQLASMKIYEIKSILEAAGPRFSMHDPSSWPQQAMLARDGDWPVLRRLQDELDKGKIVK